VLAEGSQIIEESKEEKQGKEGGREGGKEGRNIPWRGP